MKLMHSAKILYLPGCYWALLLLPALLGTAGCRSSREAPPPRSHAGPRAPHERVQTGLGSYYASKFNGRSTASGSTYHPSDMTAAHNTLPFGTLIRVTNTRNGRSVEVTVTDRGPHTRGYIVDVSHRAAVQLDIIEAGVVPVEITVVRPAPGNR
ncbi:MAG: septal ring lytic transglycosylase RlpA family protein [Bacteroidota bacterium]|nr:septal ring lytic transglycosylase RlpA family protein [Bacteroidota bacterium]